MSEHQRKNKQRVIDQAVTGISKEYADKGKIIELGWLSLRAFAIPPDAPPIQIEEMRNAFFAGAQHLFASIMTIMDDDAEPTAADLHKMDLIEKELNDFIAIHKLKHLPTEGNG